MQCQVATLYEDEALYYVHVHSIQGCFKKYAGDIQHAKNILVNRLKVLAHIKGEVVNSQKLFFCILYSYTLSFAIIALRIHLKSLTYT